MEAKSNQPMGDLLLVVFGGTPYLDINNVTHVILWLLLLVPWLIIIAKSIERNTDRRCFQILIRLGSYNRWWNRLCCLLVFTIVLLVLVGMASVSAAGIILTGKWDFSTQCTSLLLLSLILSLHLFMHSMFITVLQIYTGKPVIPLFASMFIVFTAFFPAIGYEGIVAWYPGSWGMLLRSSLYGNKCGYNIFVITITEIVICAALYFVGRYITRTGEIAALRINR